MNMTAGAPEGRFYARKTILREGNQLVAELDFPVAEFVESVGHFNRISPLYAPSHRRKSVKNLYISVKILYTFAYS